MLKPQSWIEQGDDRGIRYDGILPAQVILLPQQHGELIVAVPGIDLAAKEVGRKRVDATEIGIDIIPLLVDRVVQDIRGINDAPVLGSQHFVAQ